MWIIVLGLLVMAQANNSTQTNPSTGLKALNTDAMEPLRLSLNATVKAVLSCDGLHYQQLHVGNMHVQLLGLLPSICPFKYDPQTLGLYQRYMNLPNPDDGASCEDSASQLSMQDPLWRHNGFRLWADIRVCASLNHSHPGITKCDPWGQGFWHVNSTMVMSPELACLSHQQNKSVDIVYTTCYAIFYHPAGMQVSIANVDSFYNKFPPFLQSAMEQEQEDKTIDKRFVTNPTLCTHNPAFSMQVNIPIPLLKVDPQKLRIFENMMDQAVRETITKQNKEIADPEKKYPMPTRKTNLTQCSLVLSDLPGEMLSFGDIVSFNKGMEKLHNGLDEKTEQEWGNKPFGQAMNQDNSHAADTRDPIKKERSEAFLKTGHTMPSGPQSGKKKVKRKGTKQKATRVSDKSGDAKLDSIIDKLESLDHKTRFHDDL